MALIVGGTDYVQMPVGTTGQRPTTPATGMTRYNSTTGLLEYYNGTSWLGVGGYSVTYLVVGGGAGAGGNNAGGGGGATAYSATMNLTPSTTYTVTVGAGGRSGCGRAS